MKLVNPSNPVTSAWLAEQGFRLDPAPYLSGALEAKKLLERFPRTDKLSEVTAGHNGGIFNGPKFSRIYLHDPERTVPFLGSTDMMEADLSFLPRLSKEVAEKFPYLKIEPGMTLISCSGTIGRMAYVRSDMKGICSSQHIMKVAPKSGHMLSGYLYTFLRSPYGVPMIASSAYGAIIQHIEPHHIAGLPVPRFGEKLEQKVHELVEEASQLRTAFQEGVVAATEDLFRCVGLPELNELRWHQQERDLGFGVKGVGAVSLRASNYGERARRIKEAFTAVPNLPLGEICRGGKLSRGLRAARLETGEGHGVRLLGQRQAFWNRPEDRWIKKSNDPGIFAEDETIMVTAQGLVSESGLFGRSMFVTGSWLKYAYTEHFLRVYSPSSEISGAYLFSFFRSEVAFRLMRSMLAGTGPQSIHPALLAELPIPLAPPADRERIAETVRQAYRDRDQADVLEDQALALLTEAIEREAAV
ncbi:restriction endonuclease subunit S [Streptomyces sp. NPDC050610]|uniref:methylation-associated defense system restriction endonuclease subunit S MAD5 n=1 Tax=Streptomyces sp. NPDC050610 TaxID=3157097 RepID=UPI003447EE1B